MTDQWNLIFFNLLFTSAPPIIFGILDKDVSGHTLIRQPELYKASQRSEVQYDLTQVPDSLIIVFLLKLNLTFPPTHIPLFKSGRGNERQYVARPLAS